MQKPQLSIIIPAYQEAARLGSTLDALFAYLSSAPFSAEIVVVDDGSQDGTGNVAAHYGGRATPLRVLRHPVNRGKGAAVRTGMLDAHGAYALLSDADSATPIEESVKLLDALKGGKDVAIGSRYLAESRIEKHQPVLRRMMSRMGNLLFRAILGLPYQDTRCGFKMFTEAARRTIFSLQRLERFGFDTEILVIAKEQGLRVAEVPVRWSDRARSTIHPFRDSIRSLQEIVEIVRRRNRGEYRNMH